MSKQEEKTCVVREVESDLEGQIFEDLLQEAGIPAMVPSYGDSAFDGYERSARGWGRVIVLAEDREAAEKVIAEYVASLEQPKRGRKKKKESK